MIGAMECAISRGLVPVPIWTGSRQLASGTTSQEIADVDFEAI